MRVFFCWKGKDMFKNKILKKIGAGLMAGLCAFTLIGTNIGGLKTSAATTAKEPLLSGDEVIKQAANEEAALITYKNEL